LQLLARDARLDAAELDHRGGYALHRVVVLEISDRREGRELASQIRDP